MQKLLSLKAVSWPWESVLKYLRCSGMVLISMGPSSRLFLVLTGEMMCGNKSVKVSEICSCLLAVSASAVYLVPVGSRLSGNRQTHQA